MSRKAHLWRKFIYLFVVLTQLVQPIANAFGAPAPNLSRANVISDTTQPPVVHPPITESERSSWSRPEVDPSVGFSRRVDPASIALIPPVPVNQPTSPAAQGLAFFGNNNFGQSYKDTNNPEDHPGKHFAGPVNLVNGNYFLTVGDHFFAAQGLSVQFARSYNSQDETSGPLGKGWTHSFNIVAEDTIPNMQVTIRNADGSRDVYTSSNGGATWNSPPGLFRLLNHPAPGAPFQLLHKSGLVQFFLPDGRLQAIIDRQGNALQMQYDGLNRLVAILSPDGRSLLVSYHVANPNLIASVTDPIGRTTLYNYDPAGNLVSVNYPEGSTATYAYDGLSRLTSFDDPRQPEGQRQVVGLQYDGLSRVTQVQYTVESYFNVAYNVTPPPYVRTNWQDALGQTHSIVFDGNYNIITSFTFFADCACIQGEGYNYFPNLLLQNRQDTLGNQTLYTYDGMGNMLTVISPSGARTDFAYDPLLSNVISTTNPAGNTILYLYDDAGNLTQEVHPLGRTATYTYDAAGNLLSQSDALGNTTTYTYDPRGNLTSITDPVNHTTTFTYDLIGRVTEKLDPFGGTTTYEYDALDRLTRVTDPLGGMIDYTYDTRSNLTSLTDANGNT
ncbi:MAG: RHS repeat protein, partial [Anaerolineales bacterium]|nr:RHS repeat protein [Anaerolineales bacterium]